MESQRFDILAKTLSTAGTRRGLLRLLAIVPLAEGLLPCPGAGAKEHDTGAVAAGVAAATSTNGGTIASGTGPSMCFRSASMGRRKSQALGRRRFRMTLSRRDTLRVAPAAGAARALAPFAVDPPDAAAMLTAPGDNDEFPTTSPT